MNWHKGSVISPVEARAHGGDFIVHVSINTINAAIYRLETSGYRHFSARFAQLVFHKLAE